MSWKREQIALDEWRVQTGEPSAALGIAYTVIERAESGYVVLYLARPGTRRIVLHADAATFADALRLIQRHSGVPQ